MTQTNDDQRRAGEPLELTIYGVKVVFRYCPSGTFLMGSPEDEEDRSLNENQHEVTFTRGFWTQESTVTQALWEAATGTNPSEFRGAELPVENVSWNEAADFIAKLNKEGFAPEGLVFSFPTDAEWEYACRAGTTTAFHFGPELAGDKANCDGVRRYPYDLSKGRGTFLKKTTPAGAYEPNAWGLYDMHGNVWEWTSDWYVDETYQYSPATDPTGPESGTDRILRGGRWNSSTWNCRAAYRFHHEPTYGELNFGLRLVLRAAE